MRCPLETETVRCRAFIGVNANDKLYKGYNLAFFQGYCYNIGMEEVKKKNVSSEDMLDCMNFVDEFTDELKKYPHRITGSADETACARAIRNRLHDETGAKTRLEAFNGYPLFGRGSFLYAGIWYALCYTIYFVSFAGGRVGGILITLLSLLAFLAGTAIIAMQYLGKRKLLGIYKKKVSYNVVSEYSKNDAPSRTIIIADNHDATLGTAVKDFDLMRKLSMIIAPVSVFLFVLFCILKMAIGTDGANVTAKITAFTVLPVMSGVFGIAAFVLHFSPREKNARQNNGVSTAVAMATYAYFVDRDEKLANDVKIVYASFGGENGGRCGSYEFVQAHPEYAGAQVLCVGDILGNDLQVAEYDAVRRIQFSTDTVAVLHASAIEQGIPLKTAPHDDLKHKFNSLHGYMSNAFAKNGNPTATLLSKDYSEGACAVSRETIENLFALCVGAVERLMTKHEQQSESDKKDELKVAPSAEMEIVDVESK